MSDSKQKEDKRNLLQKYCLMTYEFSAILKMFGEMSDEDIDEIGGRHVITKRVAELVKAFDDLKFKRPLNPTFDNEDDEEIDSDVEDLKQEAKILNKNH